MDAATSARFVGNFQTLVSGTQVVPFPAHAFPYLNFYYSRSSEVSSH